MRLTQVSIVMASVSLGAAVVLFLKVERLEQDLGTARAVSREARGAEVAARTAEGGPYEAPAWSAEGGPQASHVAEAPVARARGTGPAAAAGPVSVEDRLARLEAQQKALEAGPVMPWRQAQAFARNMDDLSQKLSLTPTQRTRIEDAVGRGRQRIEDVLKIPDETGKSPFERRVEARKKLEEAMKNPQPGGVLAFATDMISYRDRKIPGRNETYRDEIDRIRKETREEIATALDPRQQEAFGQTNVDGLLGEAAQVSVGYAISDGANEQAGMIVHTTEVTADDGEAPEPAPEAPGTGGR